MSSQELTRRISSVPQALGRTLTVRAEDAVRVHGAEQCNKFIVRGAWAPATLAYLHACCST